MKLCTIACLCLVCATRTGDLSARPVSSDYEVKPIALPGATGAVALDYFAYDRATGKLWVPASNTGSVGLNLMIPIAALLWART
jgi:hypothetical protein